MSDGRRTLESKKVNDTFKTQSFGQRSGASRPGTGIIDLNRDEDDDMDLMQKPQKSTKKGGQPVF